MESLQGKLLIASAQLLDPNFVRSVILMVQHDENGALGLILNRPLKVTVKEACEKAMEIETDILSPLHQGGPCEGPLMALHTDPENAQVEVIDGIHFSAEREQVEQLLAGDGENARFYIGYSGWSAGQLESEMETGSWLIAQAQREYIMNDLPRLWHTLFKQLTLGQWIDPARIPDDPSVN